MFQQTRTLLLIKAQTAARTHRECGFRWKNRPVGWKTMGSTRVGCNARWFVLISQSYCRIVLRLVEHSRFPYSCPRVFGTMDRTAFGNELSKAILTPRMGVRWAKKCDSCGIEAYIRQELSRLRWDAAKPCDSGGIEADGTSCSDSSGMRQKDLTPVALRCRVPKAKLQPLF